MTRAARVALVSALVAACGSSPPSQFFTLDAPASLVRAPDATAAKYSVVVGPVTVPDRVDRPQLVIRTAPHQVDIVEFARWAEPLRESIPRVIAGEVQARLPDARVAASTPSLAAAADYRVTVAIERFDATPGGEAIVDAVWTIGGPRGEHAGRTSVREPAGRAYAELAEAYARALRRVGADIAAALGAARAGG